MKLKRGFSLIELMIALALISVLSIGLSKYLKRSQVAMSDGQPAATTNQTSQEVQKRLTKDIQQAVFLRPTCDEKPAPSVDIDRPCSDIKVVSGIVIYPGASRADMTARSDLAAPSNLEEPSSSLTYSSDAIRLALFDYQGSFNCSLVKTGTVNPPVIEGSEGESLRVGPECEDLLREGQVYALVEMFDTDPYSPNPDDLVQYANVFQATGLDVTEGSETLISATSFGNLFNQTGGLGLSGFSKYARIYPIKFVEWAYDDGSGGETPGLYRRELNPTGDALSTFGSWKLIEASVEGIQFHPVTISPTGYTQHNRTMDFDATDPYNDGLEDIRGVTIRTVIKSATPTQNESATYDNPLTAEVESDNYPRTDSAYYIDLRNTEVMN